MKLYLVRHAESISNKNGTVSNANSLLSKNGISQAHLLGQKLLSQTNFAAIYSSPYARAKQTAEIIASYDKRLDVIETDLIIEKKDASFLEGETREKIPWDLIMKMRVKPDWRHKDGESFNDVKKRVIAVFTEMKKYQEDANILMISHNSFIKHLTAYVLLGDKFIPEFFYPIADRLGTRNGGVTILEQKQKYYETKPSWYLASWMR